MELRRDVLLGSEDAATGLTVGEGLISWLQNLAQRKRRQQVRVLEQIQRMRRTLASVEAAREAADSAGALQQIDVHQLEVENEEFSARVKETAKEVSRQKKRCCEASS